MTFTASSVPTAEGAEDEGTWVPPEIEEGVGAAARHTDNRLQTKLTPEGLQKRLLSLFYEGQTLERRA